MTRRLAPLCLVLVASCGGTNGPAPDLRCSALDLAGKSWEPFEIDVIGGAPIYPEVAVGADGEVFVAFTKGTASARFPAVARFDGERWSSPEVVEQQASTYLGKRPSLVVDGDGALHLVYYNEDAMRPRYAFKPRGGDWSKAYLYASDYDAGDHSSLALAPDGRLRTSFLQYGDYRLVYGEQDAEDWGFATLARDGAAVRVSTGSLAVDGQGRSHLLYVGAQGVGYARGGLDGFAHEDVELTTRDTGHYPSLVVDEEGRAHAAYLEWPSDASALWVADRSDEGWTTTRVDDGLGITYTTGLVSHCGTLVVAYARNLGAGPAGLNVAYRLTGSARFVTTQVDGSVDVSGISLAAARDGTLHVVYLDESNLVLRHARLLP